MTRRKLLGLLLAAALLMTTTVFGTMAYLSASDQAVNTFTSGTVALKLDEADVDEMGVPIPDAKRVKKNDYRLLPGHSYSKDPTVTVMSGSEESYIRILLTVSKSDGLDEAFAPEGAKLDAIFANYDPACWQLVDPAGVRDATADTICYEFRYKQTVAAPDGDVALEPLFTGFTVPWQLTKEKLALINGMSITAQAHAIQADGFANADAAWAAF